MNYSNKNLSSVQIKEKDLINSTELFHPIFWLQSVGQFLGDELNNNYLVSAEGRKSVKAEMA